MSIVNRIQDLCSRKNTTLIGLEREIGLGRGTIRNWNNSSPSADKLQKVAAYFGVSNDYILLGFDRALLVQLVNYIRDDRTEEDFARDTGIDAIELSKLCMGLITEQPPIEVIEKIAANNPIDFIVDREELFKAAGYFPEDIPAPLVNSVSNDEDKEIIELARKIKKLPPEKKRVLKTITEADQTIAAHRTDDPSSELPEEARKSIEDFKRFIFEKHGIKYD